MITALIFWLFLLSAYVVIFVNGAAVERIFVNLLVLASFATLAAQESLDPISAPIGVLAVDASLLVVVLVLALQIDKYWPLWFAAFQGVAVASELASILFPSDIPAVYQNVAGLWALPALGWMAWATVLDNRAGLNRRHHDRSAN